MVNLEFQAINPGTLHKPEQVMRLLREVARKEAEKIKRDLLKPTQSWDHRVDMEITPSGSDSFIIGTSDKVYSILNAGSPPHVIAAKKAPRLAFFAAGFRAKTRPRRLSSGAGRQANSDFVRPLIVQHPGTVAREWTRLARERSQPRFEKAVLALMHRIGRQKK